MTERQRLLFAAYAPIKVLTISWLGIVLLTLVVYAVDAAAPALGDLTWADAAHLGTSLWLLSVGGPLSIAEATVTMVPSTFTLLIALALYREIKRSAVFTWAEISVCTGSALLATAIIALFGVDGSNGPLGALVAALVTFMLGLIARFAFRAPEGKAWGYVEEAVALTKALRAILLVTALVLFFVTIVVHHHEISTINGYYVENFAGTAMLTLVQLAYFPTFVIASLAYAIGAGFSVGSGTLFSAFGVTTQPLPAVPVFGALPSPGTAQMWIPILLALVACAFGIYRVRRATANDGLRLAGTSSAALLFYALLLGFLGSGSIGPGRMHVVGASPLRMVIAMAVCIALPHAIGLNVRFAKEAFLRWRARGSQATAAESNETTPAQSEVDDPVDADTGVTGEPASAVVNTAEFHANTLAERDSESSAASSILERSVRSGEATDAARES